MTISMSNEAPTNNIRRQQDFQLGLAAAQTLATDNPEALQDALGYLQEISGASRVYIFENFTDPEDGLCIRQIAEACAPDVKSEIDNQEMQHLSYAAFAPRMPTILRDRNRYISDIVANMSDSEREVLESQDILAILIIPIYVNDLWFGFIGFDNTYTTETWGPEAVELLRTSANLIGSYLSRQGQQVQLTAQVEAQAQALAKSRIRERSIIASMPDPIIIYNQTGEVVFFNAIFSDVFGWSFEELKGKRVKFVPETHMAELSEIIQVISQDGILTGFETQRKTKDGQLLDVLLSASTLYDDEGSYDGAVVILRDITQKKRDEAALRDYQTGLEDMVDQRAREIKKTADKSQALLDALPDLMYQFDINGQLIDQNTKTGKKSSFATKSAPSQSLQDIFSPDVAKLVKEAIDLVLKTGRQQIFRYEAPLGQETRQYEGRFSPSGDATVLMLARDITESQSQERQIRYQSDVLENISDAVIASDLNFVIRAWNKGAETIYGYTAEETIGHPASNFISTEYLEMTMAEVNQTIMGEGRLLTKTKQTTRHGQEYIIMTSATLLRDKNNVPTGFIVINRDITALEQAAQRNRALLNAIPDLIFQFDQKGRFIDYKAEHSRTLLMQPEAFMHKHITDVLPPSIANPAFVAIQKVLDTGEMETFEYQVPIKERVHQYEARIVASENNTILMLARDVTNESRALRTLEERERLLQTVFNTLPQSIFWKDRNGTYLGCNENFAKAAGTTVENILGKTDYDLNWTQDNAEHYATTDLRIMEENVTELGTIESRTEKDDKKVWTETNKAPLHDSEGNVIGLVGTFEFVTERLEQENQLRYQANIFENISETVVTADLNFIIRSWNKAAERTYGYTAEETIGEFVGKFIDSQYMDTTREEANQRLFTTGHIVERVRQKTKNGREFIIMTSITLAKDSENKPTRFIVINRDITELERAAEERQRLNQIVANTSDFVALLDPEYNITFMNKAAQEMVGRSFTGETELNIADVIPAKSVDLIFDVVFPYTQKHGRWTGDTFLQHQDGRNIPVSQAFSRHLDSEGNVVYYSTIARDVSVQTMLAQQTEASLQRYSRQVHLTTSIAQQISSAEELDEIYNRVVKFVKEEFGHYHTQLLQYNPTTNLISLVVGYGKIGTVMRDAYHAIPYGIGLIGIAAATGRSILSPDVTIDPDWLPNPLLPDTKGELAIPIMFQNTVLGVLDIQSDKRNHLTEEDRVILEGLSGQIAIAIENTRLRQDMEQRLEELSNLQRLMIREGWDQYIATQRDQSGFLFDQDSIQPFSFGGNENGQATNGTSSANLSNLSTTTTSPLVVKPIRIRGESIGSIGIQDTADQPLTIEERELLDEISLQIGEALENARLLEQTHKRAVELETVARVSTTTSTILQRDQLLQSVASLAKESFNLYHANIYIIDSETEELRLIAGSGGIGELLIAEEWRIHKEEQALPAQVVRQGVGHINNDVLKDTNYIPNPFLPYTRSKLAVPMIAGGETMGVLELHSNQPNSFSNEDLQIHNTLATQTAIALQNAELFQEQLETAEKLREVDRLKSEFLANMSHELRTPLNSIIGFADVLLEGIDGELNELMREDVTLIRDGGQHLRNLIGDILDMSKIEAGMMNLDYGKVDLTRIAKEVMATTQGLLTEKDVHLIGNIEEDIGVIEADRTRLVQIFLNILSNAAKFTDQGSITLTMKRQYNFDLLVSIEDTGDGIKEEDIPLVFAQFRQVGDMQHRKAGGTGLGMPITKQLVELHGGEIWIESTYGVGTTFSFTVPHEPPTEKNTVQGVYA